MNNPGTSRWRFLKSYWLGRTRWDTGIVPPEITDLIENEAPTPASALDIGCGTGTTSVYLAQKGWQVTGLDFVPKAIRKAKRRAKHADVHVDFRVADVTKLASQELSKAHTLAIDIGCGHALGEAGFTRYVNQLADLMESNGTYMLFAFTPREGRTVGLTVDTILTITGSHFELAWNSIGEDGDYEAVWYRFQRR